MKLMDKIGDKEDVYDVNCGGCDYGREKWIKPVLRGL